MLAMVVIGCGGDPGGTPAAPDAGDSGATSEDPDAGDPSGDAADVQDAAPDRPPVGQFTAVEPGGDSLCARGTPFRFFVHGGDPTRVVVDFQGGGGCWSVFTCTIGQQLAGQDIFTDSAGDLDDLESDLDSGLLGGIYDLDDPDNPFYGWTLVRVPHCSGDFYWGDATVDYADDLTIHHRGYANAVTALTWIKAHYPDADRVVSTGRGTGSYAAAAQGLNLIELYPEANVAVLADSGVGIITESFFADAFPTWNAFATMPLHLEGLAGMDLEDITMTDFLVAAAKAYPQLRMAQYTTAHNQQQGFYYSLMGGETSEWHPLAIESLTHIRAQAENFRYYVAPGPIHCIHPYDITYTREVNGVAYMDWVRDVIGSGPLPNDVMCEADCRDDPICAGCADGSIESQACDWCDGWEP